MSQALVKEGEVRYYAYGSDRFTSGTMATTYRCTGHRTEQGIGLYFYNARWYDASLGRFAQADTVVPNVGDPQALNRYSYVNNYPVRYSDPSGHEPCDGEPTCGHPRPRRPYSLAESNREADMLVSEWWNESGPQSRTLGPDDSMTQDIMFSSGIGKFYQAWAEAGWPDEFEYRHQIEDNRSDLRSWAKAYDDAHRKRNTAVELERRGINVPPESLYDKIGTTIGSFDTIKTTRYDESLVKVEVTNVMNWKSATRVGTFAPGRDLPRGTIGRGGRTIQRFYWFL